MMIAAHSTIIITIFTFFLYLCKSTINQSNALFIQNAPSSFVSVSSTTLILSKNKHNNNKQKHSHIFELQVHSTSLQCNDVDYSFLLSSSLSYQSQTTTTTKNYSKEDLLTKEQLDYISELVDRRSIARNSGNYELADSIRDKVNNLTIQASNNYNDDDGHNDFFAQLKFALKGYDIFIKDIPLKDGGGSTWRLQLMQKESIEWEDNSTNDDCNDDDIAEHSSKDNNRNKKIKNESVLKIAHSALGLASWSSENNVPIDQQKLEVLVLQAKERLRKTGMRELRGRKAADAAFWFAMAGVKDEIQEHHPDHLKFSLYDALTFICFEEMKRFGKRSSCRAMDILHMVERIAAAGIKSDLTDSFQKLAAECLLVKDLSRTGLSGSSEIIEMLQNGDVELHSERSLLWIWRFSTRQRKQQAFLKSASKHWESSAANIDNNNVDNDKSSSTQSFQWSDIFDDATLPLIVDLGCGMGISILGLATTDMNSRIENNNSIGNLNLSHCNFVGADLSQLAINFASSVNQRWKCQGRVHFALSSAQEMMEKVIDSYPGLVKLVTIQFPTPFSFQENNAFRENTNDENFESVAIQGNKQLPHSAYSGFMVTKQLLDLINIALKDSSGKLLLQSNCEDVAILMKNIAVNEAGFHTLDVEKYTLGLENQSGLTRRTQKWIAVSGERAKGSYWSSIPFLPKKGSTETEIACLLNGTPIHRCMLEVSNCNKI